MRVVREREKIKKREGEMEVLPLPAIQTTNFSVAHNIFSLAHGLTVPHHFPMQINHFPMPCK